MPGVIEMKNVNFSAQNRKLVENISFEFEDGKTTALVGHSGCGKSTMLKLAAGLIIPDQGAVLFRGRDVIRMSRTENLEFRREAAVVFQDSALWANQTLFQTLELPLRLHFPKMSKTDRKRRIESTVAEVGYRKDLGIRPAELSMGEQKLIAFARALICRPRLLYLDEWTESLDESSANRLIELVKKMQKEGASIIFVSHDLQIVRDLADVIVMIRNGQLGKKFTREQIDKDEDLECYMEEGMAS
ncbi:MAG: ATP-binding cassette domain-containing protein [Treponema sp.]|jgi:ABC-type multidrug transport system ATPase subunit|nr:ATP-binding cassette domain-containing protein [Treponema sp.]